MKLTFGIRHLLIAVALFAVVFSWLGYHWNIVRQRNQLRKDLGQYAFQTSQIYPSCYDANDGTIPWIRKMFGDRPFGRFYFPTATSDDILERVEKLVGKTIKCGKPAYGGHFIKKPTSPAKEHLGI
jgi:hypothetical protein